MAGKRAYRRAETERIVRNRLKWWLWTNPRAMGRCKHMHPLACGRPRCKLCHRDKIFDEPKHADLRRLPPDDPD